ncbi:hypothetical protein F443_01135 [Plasmopara halstedii]|uniref:Cation/H+ exchanger domain-containing protein n=1 Tax=Plasmopara halstedii TaxID=4781 RepID=A0A0P1B7E2_PLAHL|nr:hypothetical protein F443_01135 [Plasmopara halstedii]CEG50261.1 hypothetical protein F443_01135 [Plasmopara halstedii]|eukprot:XP_024586630.1 hypothetical protein F443_01135 [Plasmopara halstedii]
MIPRAYFRPQLITTVFISILSLVVTLPFDHSTNIRESLDENEMTRRLSGGGGGDMNKTIPFNSLSNLVDTVQYVAAFIVVLVAAHPLALFFPKFFKLPLITGYLVIGIISGPFATNLLNRDVVNMLARYVSALALSFISAQAGQEIYLPELRPILFSIAKLLACMYVTAMIIQTSGILLLEETFFYRDMTFNCQLGIALMFGSISVLVSPGTVMAIKIELNSVGPFTSLMLGATMTAEFVVLISFSVARIITSIYCAELEVSMVNLIFTMSIVASNVLMGAILAGVTLMIFKIPGGEPYHEHDEEHGADEYCDQKTTENVPIAHPNLEPMISDINPVDEVHYTSESCCLSSKNVLALKGFLWLSMGYMFYIFSSLFAEVTAAMFGLSWEIKFEGLLVLMVASCIAGHHKPIRHDMHMILDTAAPYMFLPFFVMTGASLKLDQVVAAVPLMSLYIVLRYLSVFIACYCGGRFVLKLTPQQYNNLWLTLAPQAGVALGLASEVQAMSDASWASEISATIVAAVVVNQIIGPVLCGIGLSRAGETYKDRMLAAEALKGDMDNLDKGNLGGTQVQNFQGGALSHSMLGPRFSTVHGTRASNFDARRTVTSGDLSSFNKIQNAVVIGDDEVAFEAALGLSLYGAHVTVPLLDEKRTEQWRKMNDTILQHTDLISYRNTLKDRDGTQAMSTADVIIFTGDANRTRENVRMLKTLLGHSHPRMIAFVPDSKFSKEMKTQGVLVIQPSIAMANIATRMALLDQKLAESLSNEISTTSEFSTAAYFMHADNHDFSEMRFEGRRLALNHNVVNHHSVDYDRLADALRSERLPMPPPPRRVAMYGTSSADGYDPFNQDKNLSEFFVVHDEHDEHEVIMNAHYSSRRNPNLSLQRSSIMFGSSQLRGGRRTPRGNKSIY